jgi:hypothetical protein
MSKPEVREKLFDYARERLSVARLPKNAWSFGGGTVLMLKYNHRFSKDIDIFFRDAQLLSAVSPRINDAAEENILDYAEHTRFTKIQFPDGEVDFIVSPQITNCRPQFEGILGEKVYVDSPVEIVAKKIRFRVDEFKPRVRPFARRPAQRLTGMSAPYSRKAEGLPSTPENT